VHLEHVLAVFQIVAHADDLRRQLLVLAHRHKSRTQRVGQRRREDEAPRFDSQHHVHFQVAIVRFQPVDDARQPGGIFQQGGDVVEENARFGKVGHLANQRLQIWH